MDKKLFNSQAPHFMQHVHAYCAKVIPLVFDNSLSYYEFLCKMCHKLNEAIDTINSQNLNIIEFTKMVQLEVEKFETYVDNRMTDYENDIKTAWENFKTLLAQDWANFKTQLENEWQTEKEANAAMRSELRTMFDTLKTDLQQEISTLEQSLKEQWNEYKETVNAEIQQFEEKTETSNTEFKQAMQNQLDQFENHMTAAFTQFSENESNTRQEFQSNFQQLFEQWQHDTIEILNNQFAEYGETTKTALTTHINTIFANAKNELSARLDEMQEIIDTALQATSVSYSGANITLDVTTIKNAYAINYNAYGNKIGEGYVTGAPPSLSIDGGTYCLFTCPVDMPTLSFKIAGNIVGSGSIDIYVLDTIPDKLDVDSLAPINNYPVTFANAVSEVLIGDNTVTNIKGYIIIKPTGKMTMYDNKFTTRVRSANFYDKNTNTLITPKIETTSGVVEIAHTLYDLTGLSAGAHAKDSIFVAKSQFLPHTLNLTNAKEHCGTYLQFFSYLRVTSDTNNDAVKANPRIVTSNWRNMGDGSCGIDITLYLDSDIPESVNADLHVIAALVYPV